MMMLLREERREEAMRARMPSTHALHHFWIRNSDFNFDASVRVLALFQAQRYLSAWFSSIEFESHPVWLRELTLS